MTPAPAGASIIDLRAYVDPSVVPILVLVDLQQEYIATARALAVPGAAAALANCRAALTHARAKGFPVAFVRWLARSAFFNPATRFSRWIEGFEPFGSDMVFERGQPSCYASTSFDQVMTECGGNFVLAGFAGEAACLRPQDHLPGRCLGFACARGSRRRRRPPGRFESHRRLRRDDPDAQLGRSHVPQTDMEGAVRCQWTGPNGLTASSRR